SRSSRSGPAYGNARRGSALAVEELRADHARRGADGRPRSFRSTLDGALRWHGEISRRVRTVDRVPIPRRQEVIMKIIVSLSFQGQCREAFELYARVLGGEITTAVPYGEGPPGRPVDPRYRRWLMHSWLQVGDQALIGADLLPE